MANSKITLTFNDEIDAGEAISIKYADLDDLGGIGSILEETWQTPPRAANYVIQAEADGIPLGTASALSYSKFFNIDYNGSGKFVVTYIPSLTDGPAKVVIEALVVGKGFTDCFVPAQVDCLIENDVAPVDFTVVGDITANINPCISYDLQLTTSLLALKWWGNGVLLSDTNTDNPIDITLLRGVSFRFEFEHLSGAKTYYPSQGQPSFVYMRKLLADNFSAAIENSLNGATVTINEADLGYPISILSLVLEYSLDDISYGSSNVFSGQDVGSYTMYVKDQYGCKINFGYTVSALSVNTPFLFISKANSINFLESVVWDGCLIFKNDENTLSNQKDNVLKGCGDILFQTCDKSTIQFKSNFLLQTITLRDSDLNEVSISVSKMSANLARFESMDCICYDYNETQLGIYFDSGKTYDEFGADLSTYTLNGNLPDFGIIGQYITVENGVGYHKIVDVIFDSDKKKKVILIDYVYDGIDFATSCKSLYNLLNYEIYQFEIDWNTHGVGLYDIVMFNSDPNLGDVYHQSENILVQDTHETTIAIRYYNENNRDIFYMYGQQNFIRVPYLSIVGVPLDESSVNAGDLITELSKSSVHEADKIEFDYVDKTQMRKIVLALSMENLFINGVGYVKNESVEVEPLPGTDLYKIEVQLIKTNDNYNNNKQGQTGVDYDYETFDIPAFITDGTNLLKE